MILADEYIPFEFTFKGMTQQQNKTVSYPVITKMLNLPAAARATDAVGTRLLCRPKQRGARFLGIFFTFMKSSKAPSTHVTQLISIQANKL